MRDSVAAEDHGIPTVTLTTEDIVQMSTEQATVLGLPDLPVVPMRVSLYGRPREEIASLAEPYVGGIEAGLTS